MTKPPRLAVITSKTLRVFEGRKFLAEYSIEDQLTVKDVEAARTAESPLELTQGNTS